jgi:ubiquitin carboxyl-terminal hydrolase 14
VNQKLKEVDRDRRERTKIRKKTKKAVESASKADDAMAVDETAPAAPAAPAAAEATTEAAAPAEVPVATAHDLEDESVYRTKEREAIEKLIHADVKADLGANASGLYDLCGEYFHD